MSLGAVAHPNPQTARRQAQFPIKWQHGCSTRCCYLKTAANLTESMGVRSVRAEPFDVLRTGFVEAFCYRKNPFGRLRANGLINNPGLKLFQGLSGSKPYPGRSNDRSTARSLIHRNKSSHIWRISASSGVRVALGSSTVTTGTP